jgi:hypothetical protein
MCGCCPGLHISHWSKTSGKLITASIVKTRLEEVDTVPVDMVRYGVERGVMVGCGVERGVGGGKAVGARVGEVVGMGVGAEF